MSASLKLYGGVSEPWEGFVFGKCFPGTVALSANIVNAENGKLFNGDLQEESFGALPFGYALKIVDDA